MNNEVYMAKKKSKDLSATVLYQTFNQGVVLYVDGGCRIGYPSDPNTKYGGWGIHGYTYDIGVMPNKRYSKKDAPSTSGYKPGDTVPIEQQVVPTGYIDGYGSIGNKDTSDKAELIGFNKAIELVKEKGYKQAHLLLDNQYVINGVNEHYPKWVSLGWKKSNGDPYANKTLWESTMSVYQPLAKEVDFTVSWVNGHSGNLGNDRADYLATKGVYLGRNGVLDKSNIKYSPIAKYRDPKPNVCKLFNRDRWYFNTHPETPDLSKDGRYVYHCGGHGDDDTLVGKPTATASVYVLYLKQPEPVLDAVRKHHAKLIPNPLNDLCMARLSTLLLPRVYDEIQQDGVNTLSIASNKHRYDGLCTIDGQEVTKVIKPAGLTFKLIDVHNFLQSELDRYLDGKAHLTDITNLIYDITTDKKGNTTYKYIVPASSKVLRIPVNIDNQNKPSIPNIHQCNLTWGIDICPRDLFNRIKDHTPKVYVSTWLVSEFAFRYAVIIEAGEDSMIWMGKDSNLQFIYPDKKNSKGS